METDTKTWRRKRTATWITYRDLKKTEKDTRHTSRRRSMARQEDKIQTFTMTPLKGTLQNTTLAFITHPTRNAAHRNAAEEIWLERRKREIWTYSQRGTRLRHGHGSPPTNLFHTPILPQYNPKVDPRDVLSLMQSFKEANKIAEDMQQVRVKKCTSSPMGHVATAFASVFLTYFLPIADPFFL